jgi:methylase of polypeptide subunit release factors
MPHSATAYEQSLPLTHRVLNGQYYTPAFLCDLILALCFRQSSDYRLLEPSCGAGAFLVRAKERHIALQQSDISPHSINRLHLHGIELDQQATELAQAQLSKHASETVSSVIQNDNFLSPTINIDRLGVFDIIVGNPPYVRQEHIAQSTALDKQAIIEHLRPQYADYLQAWPEQQALFSQTADLYIWFFLQATTLLKPGGRLAFITSNSWLNTAYGQTFRQFLNHYFHIRYLVESACERWFPDAAINALVTVLEKKSQPNLSGQAIQDQHSPIEIIRFRNPLQTWLPPEHSPTYWQQLDRKIDQLDSDPNIDHKYLTMGLLKTHRTNWALPLRAPLNVTSLLHNTKLWLRLDQLGHVRYPIKTGINQFFYVSRSQAEHWSLEPEFLFPAIRSARNIKRYAVDTSDCDTWLFACPFSKEHLAQSGKHSALAYIEWGEQQTAPPRQKRIQPTPWPEVASVQANQPGWHALRPIAPAHILCNRFIDRRFFFALCQGELIEDQTFYGLTLSKPDTTPAILIAALLNTTLSYLLLEFNGRTSLGEGVLQFARCDMAALPVLNPNLFSLAEQTAIADHFQSMLHRPILPLPEEIHQADRIELDRLVLTPILKHIQQTGFQDTHLTFWESWTTALLNRLEERQTLARYFRQQRADNSLSQT